MSAPAAAYQDADEAALWVAFRRDGSAAARERLFVLHAPYARKIALRHHRENTIGDIELGDLRQHAYAGLLEALDRFDPEHGAPFRAFAAHRISGSIREGLSRMSEVREQISWRHRMRRERTRSLTEMASEDSDTVTAMNQLAEIAVGLALGFMLEGTGLFLRGDSDSLAAQKTGYDSAAWKEMVADLEAELVRLPEREQTILREHYASGVNFDQLAAVLGVTKGRVSQLHRAALALLRRRLDRRGHFRLER